MNINHKINKEEFKKVVKDIDDKLYSFIKEGNYKDVLLKMGNLSKYSLLNQIYILMQKEDATYVCGIKGWNYLKRSIIKGEKGIHIISPIKTKIIEKDELGEEIKNYQVISGYKRSIVFDISQTSGKEIKNFKINEDIVVKNKDLIIKSLLNVMDKIGYKLDYKNKEFLGKGCYGLCNHKSKMIYLLNELSDISMVSTLIHEVSHAILHNPYDDKFRGIKKIPNRDIKEVEAESVSCIVCSYLGLDTTNFSFSYICGWADGDIRKFRENLNIISDCAFNIIKAIEDKLYQIFLE